CLADWHTSSFSNSTAHHHHQAENRAMIGINTNGPGTRPDQIGGVKDEAEHHNISGHKPHI
ncbi:Hypothetical predicted protein, partial [Pelobates cultripes]